MLIWLVIIFSLLRVGTLLAHMVGYFVVYSFICYSCSKCSLKMKKKMKALTLEKQGLNLTNLAGNLILWVVHSMLK